MKKPMLLSNDDFTLCDLDYTEMYISEKRDGVRAEVSNKGILGRSLKVLPNKSVQDWFKEVYQNLPDGIIIEAEIHSESLPCRVIAGICNSKDKEVPEDLKLYMFGFFHENALFTERITLLKLVSEFMDGNRYSIIKQTRIRSAKEVTKFYNKCIKNGYEGSVIMCGTGKYKQGRVTIREGIGWKLKPQREDDLEIVGISERLENLNESQTNELGHSFKRNTKLDKKGTGIAATFICKLPNGENCGVTLTGDEKSRREIWKNKDSYIGRIAVVKSLDYGAKNLLRHPILVKIKEKCEK